MTGMLGEIPVNFKVNLGIPLESFTLTQDVDPLEPEEIAQLKKLEWEARKRLAVREVLDASDAVEEDVAFLTGQTNIDPHPFRRIHYQKLMLSTELVEFPDDLDFSKPVIPEYRSFDRQRRPIINRIKGIVQLVPPPMSISELGSAARQQAFQDQVSKAIVVASSNNMRISEWGFLEKAKDLVTGSRLLYPEDPHPNHLPLYYKLVPAPPRLQETIVRV